MPAKYVTIGDCAVHYLHTIAWLVDKIAEGDGVAWLFLGGVVLVLAGCVARDLWVKRGPPRPGRGG